MTYHWNNLRIQNYKSIKDLQLDCGTINVFIGPPNSGKSNILEAFDVANLPYYMHSEAMDRIGGIFDLKKYFRVDTVDDFFRNGDTNKPISVEGEMDSSTKGFYILKQKQDENQKGETKFDWKNWFDDVVSFSGNLEPLSYNRGYRFINETFRYTDLVGIESTQSFFYEHLMAPFGFNLGAVIRNNEELKELVKEYSAGSGFELAIDKTSNKISIQLRLNSGLVVTLPFAALSDTFRRMLFYKAAIQTSFADILTLEEPEALSYPPYITQLAQDIISESYRKQFFITTHSPYLLNEFIENVDKEKLAVFVCHYSQDEKQTKARRLSPRELTEIQNFGVDLFFNLNPYLNDHSEHSA